MRTHTPLCPPGTDVEGLRAEIVVGRPDQGWYLLCNGVLVFDDGGTLLTDHWVVAWALAVQQ